MENKTITLPNGNSLELEFTSDFISKIKEHYDLKDNSAVTDDHVRMFIYSTCKDAFDKAEREIEKRGS